MTHAGDRSVPRTIDRVLAQLAALVRGAAACEPLAGAVIVGGAVRDALLGRDAAEIDVAVPGGAGEAQRFAALAASALSTRVVAIGREPWPLYRVPFPGGGPGQVDIVPMQGSRDEDLARRDFTVNALALPLVDAPAAGLRALDRTLVLDNHGGLSDLDRRVLRATAPSALAADPIRALRAVRLATELDFTIEVSTLDAVRAEAGSLATVAGERVGAELLRLFAAPDAARGVRLLEASALLEVCFPGLAAGRDVEQWPVHRFRVLEHQLVASEWIDALIAPQPPGDVEHARAWHGLWDEPWPATRWGAPHEHLWRHRVALRMATLLHDAGKPSTRSVEPDGRTHFFGHAERGAAIARADLARWRLPGALIDRIALLIEQHLRPGQVRSPGEPPTAKALHRFHRALGDATPDVCWLFLADSLATVGAEALLPRWPAYVAHVRGIVGWQPASDARPPGAGERLLDGHALIAATGLAPGPAVGRVLIAVDEATATGEVRTLDEALALARRLAAVERARSSGGPPNAIR
ncbi:MAG: HD domain-containing protein [Chloroflexi bacterium]|nr:HD domain-containing protein [Chloroflexota bacterium]